MMDIIECLKEGYEVEILDADNFANIPVKTYLVNYLVWIHEDEMNMLSESELVRILKRKNLYMPKRYERFIEFGEKGRETMRKAREQSKYVNQRLKVEKRTQSL